jgi:hypothetical protein
MVRDATQAEQNAGASTTGNAPVRRTLTDADVEAVADAVAARIGGSAELVTKDELGRLLKVSSATVARYMRRGMPCTYLGDLPRFDPAACRRWVDDNGRHTGRRTAHEPVQLDGVRRITRKRSGAGA